MEAIRDACRNLGTFDLSGCELYTTAEPCPMCLGATLWANIPWCTTAARARTPDGIGFRDEVFYEYLAGGKRPAEGERVRGRTAALSCLRHIRRSREKRSTDVNLLRTRRGRKAGGVQCLKSPPMAAFFVRTRFPSLSIPAFCAGRAALVSAHACGSLCASPKRPRG